MFKLFGKKQRRQRQSRTPETRVKEQQAKVNEFLNRTYLKYLKDHPNFAEQVARERFGMETQENPGESYAEAPPDFGEKVREMREVMDLIRTEFPQDKEKIGLMDLFQDTIKQDKQGTIAKGIGDIVGALATKMKGEQPLRLGGGTEQSSQPETPQPPKQEKPSVEQQQQAWISEIEELLAMQPEEVAQIIYQHKDKPEHPYGTVYKYMTEVDFNNLVSMIPQVSSIPTYQFLQPLADKLDEKWLALVYDDLHLLIKQEIGANSA